MDRTFISRVLLLAALLCWPMLLLGHPAYYYDSAGYYQNGHTALSVETSRLDRYLQLQAPPLSGLQDPAQHVRGTRSIFYSASADRRPEREHGGAGRIPVALREFCRGSDVRTAWRA